MRSEQYHEIEVVLRVANAILRIWIPGSVSVNFIRQDLTEIGEYLEVFEFTTMRKMIQF